MGNLFQVDGATGQTRAIIQNGTTDPVSGTLGELHYRSDQELLQVFDGSIFRAVQGGSLRVYREKVNETPNGSLTVFTVDNTYVTTTTEVFLNGVLQELGVDYTESNPGTGEITFTSAPLTGAVITVSYSRLEGSGLPLFRSESQEATASQTVFNLGFVYTPGAGNLLVYSSGTLMREGASNDYVETDENTVTFNTGRTAGEVIQFIKIGAANDADTSGWDDTGTVVQLTTLSDQVKIGNDLIFGTGNTITLTAASPASNSNYTIPDVGSSSSFLMTNGEQEINGTKRWNTGQIQVFTGSTSSPGLAMNGTSKNSGLTSGSAGTNLVIVTNATEAINIDSSQNVSITNGELTVSGGVTKNTDGSAAAPSLTFSSDIDTGIYRVSANELGFATAGLAQWRITSGGNFAIDSTDNASGKVLGGVGSATAPTYTFNEAGRVDDGIFSPATSQLGFAINGTERTRITNTQLLTPDGGTNSTPSIANIDDPDTGLLWLTGSINFAVDGSQVANFADGQASFGDGSAATPGIAFLLDTDTGIYRNSANNIGFSAGGSRAFLVGPSQVVVDSAALRVQTGSDSVPSISFEDDTDTGIQNPAANQIGFSTAGVRRLTITDGVIQANLGVRFTDGSASGPGIQFTNDTNTGFFRDTVDNIKVTLGGTAEYIFAQTNFSPFTDNANSCGAGTNRWTDIFAVSGSVNTSHSTTKYDIQELEDVPIPKAVRFKRKDEADYRKGKEYIGYLNDNLPDEARAMLEDGTLDEKGNYESAVVGVLCHWVQKLKDELDAVKAQLNNK